MRTIEQLNTLLEELEKRIRNISTAQSTLAQINNICTYIANVQDYLKELNIAFDDHVRNCQDYTDDITNLQNQINEISASLEELISNDETFNALKTSFDDLKSQFETFIGSSSTTAENLENDISLLQTDLAVTQDDVTTLQSNLSDTNKTIGEHTTTITNLQTTQTNLQTTQSSQASTINSLNTRLTNCENNVNSLSGGVDISDYEARLTALENTINTLYEIKVCLRKVVNEVTVSEILFIFYSKNKLTTTESIMNYIDTRQIPATGFYYDKLVFGIYCGNTVRFSLLVIDVTIDNNDIDKYARIANEYAYASDDTWTVFINAREVT